MIVSLFMLFAIPFCKETFPTCTANIRALVAMHVHVRYVHGFVHESLVADVALESVLSLVSLHVILVSTYCFKSFATEVTVQRSHGGMCRFRLLEVHSCSSISIAWNLRLRNVPFSESDSFDRIILARVIAGIQIERSLHVTCTGKWGSLKHCFGYGKLLPALLTLQWAIIPP